MIPQSGVALGDHRDDSCPDDGYRPTDETMVFHQILIREVAPMTDSPSDASTESTNFDLIVIGGGIAGVSVGYELAADRRVCLLEMESTLAFHTTGRSAASYLETYGHTEVRAFTTGSRAFFENPPEHFDGPLLSPRPLLQFARHGRGPALRELHAEVLERVPEARLLSPADAVEVYPMLRPDQVELGLLEPGAMEIDVHGLHQGYVRGLKRRGGAIVKSGKVVTMDQSHGTWTITTADGVQRTATTVVNAAGAWGDGIAALAGARSVGLAALLRSIFMVRSPDPEATKHLPILAEIDSAFYIKPEGDQLLCSPAEETPTAPGDVRADQLEVARAIETIGETTTFQPKSVTSTWAGLRTFAADRNLVLGPEPELPGFFWYVGQGGFGIQTAPAASRVAASVLRGEEVPADVVERGLDVSKLSPSRPALSIPRLGQ